MFCPIPHSRREQAWLVIGAGLGMAGALALQARRRKKRNDETARLPRKKTAGEFLTGTEACVSKNSALGKLVFDFKVKGQKGAIPCIGFGTATLFDEVCVASVRHAIRAGYRHIDTALLYDNQEAVGRAIQEAIAAGDVTREELWVTSKVGFYPAQADGCNTKVHLSFHSCNAKGRASTAVAIDLCLKKLQLDYVDLMLIHNPATDVDEYEASGCCHFFELAGNTKDAHQISETERAMIFNNRMSKVHVDQAAAVKARAETWKALEDARYANKARFIGVSNYAPSLVAEMEQYATLMPAVNQLELHPRFASPELREQAKDLGFVLTGYGSGNSVQIEKSKVVAEIARRNAITPLGVVLRWTLQNGVGVLPRSANRAHIEENLAAADPTHKLSEEDMALIETLDQNHPYYWSPLPNLPPPVISADKYM